MIQDHPQRLLERSRCPDDFVVKVSSQVVENVPANIPRALLPEYITELILSRSPQIGKIWNLRIL